MKTDDEKIKIILRLLIFGGNSINLADIQDCTTLTSQQEAEFNANKKMFIEGNKEQLMTELLDALDNKYKGLL